MLLIYGSAKRTAIRVPRTENDDMPREIKVPSHRRSVLAVLLNPPSISSGARTVRAVGLAQSILGFENVQIANLAATPTANVVQLNHSQVNPDWGTARITITQALTTTDGIIAAWGVSGLTGSARRGFEEQVSWFTATAIRSGFDSCWTVGGRPLHPSRWHQYVADKHGRTPSGTTEQRLRHVIQSTPMQSLARRATTEHWSVSDPLTNLPKDNAENSADA